MTRLFRCLAFLMVMLTTAGAEQLPLIFVSYNIRYEANEDTGWRAWPDRLHRLIATIRRMNPDVMGVQEALHAQVADMRLSLPDYEFYGYGRDDGKTRGEYSGIFYRRSRFQADPADQGMFWLSATPEVPGSKTWGNQIPRVATWIHLIDQQYQRGFTVFNTHWDHRHQGSRVEAAALLAKRIDARKAPKDPVVLLGDFNATEGNPAVDLLAGRQGSWSSALLDAYQTLHPQVKARRTLHFWENNRDGWAKVDHILVSHPVRILHAEIIYPEAKEKPASDHYPVSATIAWP